MYTFFAASRYLGKLCPEVQVVCSKATDSCARLPPALVRWRWEDYLLEYFGVNAAGSSAFSQFDFSRKQHQDSDVSYFNKPWFHMTTFMELNFRNAAQMHTMLFESSAHTLKISDDGLQKKAKELYNRQHSLLNPR